MKGIMRALGALPLGFHYACSGALAWFLKNILRYRRDVVMTNLARSFPDKKYKELSEISDMFYKHFGRLLAEAVWFGGCRNPERLHKKRLVEFTNIDLFDEVYYNSPGIVVMTSHFGNWELLGGCKYYDYRENPGLPEGMDPSDVVFVYKPLKSKMWDEIMADNRCAPVKRLGYKGYVATEKVFRHALEHRDRKLVINMNADQSPYSVSTVDETVDFMNQTTKTMIGGAAMARKLRYAVLYSCMRPVARGRYEWRFEKICDDASEMTPKEIMQRYYSMLQADLEELPWCYLWSHKRWKK